ncbi:hypothetical protein ATANTOWER_015129, partial [Ataeniobius toweri]|nr:hypothetical protein [Ataeniobius toweri]
LTGFICSPSHHPASYLPYPAILLSCSSIISSIPDYIVPVQLLVAGELVPISSGLRERCGTPWTGRQSITGQHRDTQDKQPCTHPLTPKGIERERHQLT